MVERTQPTRPDGRQTKPAAKPVKPRTVGHAELALWLWTVWTCGFGAWQSRGQVAEIEGMLDQTGGMISIDGSTLFALMLAGYVVIGITAAVVIVRVGAGKKWARSSVMWGFLFDALFIALMPEDHAMGYLADIPDVVLQLYAIYLLYTAPGRDWFRS